MRCRILLVLVSAQRFRCPGPPYRDWYGGGVPINPKPNRYPKQRSRREASRAVLAASTRDGATEEAIRRAVGELHPGGWAMG